MIHSSRTLLLVFLLCSPFISHAQFQNLVKPQHSATDTFFLANAPVSKQQAAGIAQQYIAGRVLKVTFDGSVYRVKIVSSSGDVVSVLVDGNTGEILN